LPSEEDKDYFECPGGRFGMTALPR